MTLRHSTTPLTESAVADTTAAAVERFTEAGLSEDEVAQLESIPVHVQDLPDGYLGLATDTAIIIDADASSDGWFIDSSPESHSEFDMRNGVGFSSDSAIRTRFDLLTVIMHEMGHVLGFDHNDEWMNETLNPGERRLPRLDSLDDEFASFEGIAESL